MDILWGTTRPHFNPKDITPPFLPSSEKATGSVNFEIHPQSGVGLGIRSKHRTHAVYQDKHHIAAIIGHPRFSQEDLSVLAADKGNAAALAQAYRTHGKNTPHVIHGAFAFAIIDLKQHAVFLAIDRAGVYPLCFNHDSTGITLASTADLVLADTQVSRLLSPQALFNYLYFHTVPSPGTIYQAIEKLQPGECAWYDAHGLTRQFYWHMPYADEARADFTSLAQTFRATLREAVRRDAADHATGAFLSGGTDSSTVAGLLTEIQSRPAETFSIGFQAEGFDETEYARIATRHFNTHPHEYYVTPEDVVTAIPLIARAYDEPFGNASAVPTYFCAKLAHEAGITTLLAGDGGDELFGGNARYAKQKIFEAYHALPPALRHNLIEPLVGHAPLLCNTALFRKAQSYIHQANIPLPDRLESYNFMARTPLHDILEPEFLATVDPDAPIALLREVYARTDSTAAVNCMMHLDLKLILADNDLRKVGRMCALAGVDVRYPMLDDEVMRFSAKLPAEYKVRGQRLRWFFKKALQDFLPNEILTKSKHGFGLPFGLWMQQHPPLQALAHDSLHALRQRGLIRTSYLDELIKAHRTGHASYYGVMIWVLMMLEQWLQSHPHTQ